MTVRELALAVADALEDESKWCRGNFAKLKNGFLSDEYGSSEAMAWCAAGYGLRIGGDSLQEELDKEFSVRFGYLADSNDGPDGRSETQRKLRELSASLEGKCQS